MVTKEEINENDAVNKIEGLKNTDNQESEKKDSKWAQIGEMTLIDGVKAAWRSLCDIKLRHLAMGLGICAGIVIVVILGYYVFFPIFKFAWYALCKCFSIATGEHNTNSYHLIDGDLSRSIPLCLFIAYIVGITSKKHGLLFALMCFFTQQATLEIWDYWHIEKYGASKLLGGICFIITFVVLPILFIIKNYIEDIIETENDEE